MTQKLNKKGKKIGKPVLSGYQITFSEPMDAASLGNSANYVVAVKKIKKQRNRGKVTVLSRISFRLTNVSTDSVTVSLNGKQTFPQGGQITVSASSPAGIASSSHVFLIHDETLAIAPKGKRITFQG